MYTLLGEMSFDLILYKLSFRYSSKLKKIDHKIYFQEPIIASHYIWMMKSYNLPMFFDLHEVRFVLVTFIFLIYPKVAITYLKKQVGIERSLQKGHDTLKFHHSFSTNLMLHK